MPSKRSVTLTHRVDKGQQLFVQGESAEATYIVLRGKVRLSIGLQGQPQLPLFDQRPGAVLGLAETFLGSEYQTTATAMTKATVHEISRADLLDLLNTPEGGIPVLSVLTEKLTQMYEVLRRSTRRPRNTGTGRFITWFDIGTTEVHSTIH
jgi:CRP-like cAMP-binding protein